MSIDRRIRKLRAHFGLTQGELGARAGVTTQAVQQWEKPEQPNQKRKPARPGKESLVLIADAFNVRLSWLLSGDGSMLAGDDDRHIDSMEVAASLDRHVSHHTRTEPPFPGAIAQISGRMGAGSTGEVITIQAGEMQTVEPVAAWWGVPRMFTGLASEHIAGWPMEGDSMEPTIQRTDVVFIDTRRQRIEPDGIWAVDYGLGRALKRIKVKRTETGVRWVLMSDNPRYEPEEYEPEEVTVFGRFLFRFTMF